MLLRAISGVEHVLPDPPPAVVVIECGDSSINLEMRPWIGDANHGAPVTVAVVEAAKLPLDEAGIEIPFPPPATVRGRR